MSRYWVAPAAQSDLDNIWFYIAVYNLLAADRFIQSLVDRFEMLSQNPGAGNQRQDLRPDILCFPTGHYLIFYRQISIGIEIVRIIHGARDVPEAFRTSF